MEAIKGIYHPDKVDADTFIANFTIRVKEFVTIKNNLNKQSKKPLQHFLITGKRGMGKSTLLRRLYLEAKQNPLSDKLIAVRLGSEQYRLSRLYKLWEAVIKHLSLEEPALNDKKNKLSEEKHYEEHVIQIIIDYLARQNKTLLLLIDNFDQFIDKLTAKEQHRLREILIQYPIQIIGNAIFYNEHFFKYDKPFFDFFKAIHLKNLEKEEAEEFITRLAQNEGIENFEDILKTKRGKIETLRILSGGVPRTLVILLNLLSKKNTGDAIDYLNEMLEQVTPLYQDRMKALSSQQQEIMHYLAVHWDRTPAKELALDMRLPSKSISAQLSQLEDGGYINKISTSKRNHFYEIDERFFNIWLLMSESSAYDVKRVVWLTRWLDMFYDSNELEDYATYCNKNLKQAKPASRFLIAQALSESKKLSWKSRDQLVSETSTDLLPIIPEIKEWSLHYTKQKHHEISLLSKEIGIAIDEKNFDLALKKLEQLQPVDEASAYFGMGFIYSQQTDYDKAEQYYLLAAEKRHAGAMVNLGLLNEEIRKDYEKAERYYLMAAEKGREDAIFNLALFYHEVRRDYDKAEQYYLKAAEKGDEHATFNLGSFYQEIRKDYDKAESCYLKAVEKTNERAMSNLGFLYKVIRKDYEKAEKYYLMAVGKGHKNAMFNLGLFYDEIKKDYDKAEQYYLMAAEKGQKSAMVNLGLLYEEIRKDYEKAELYYLMAAEKGQKDAIFNLALFYHEIRKDYDKAEKYYFLAIEKDNERAMFNLGLLYEEIRKDYEKAEQYYLVAVEKGDERAINNLASLYYKRNDINKKETALTITSGPEFLSPDPIFLCTRIEVLLWNQKIKEASTIMEQLLESFIHDANAFEIISNSLIAFLVFKQKQLLTKLFVKEGLSLKDRFKPVYFALMHEMKKELPDEYLKMTKELEEPVNDLLKFIKSERIRLGIK